MSDQSVVVDLSDGVLTITLNRPERLNALNLQTLVGLDRSVTRASADPAVRAVILTGAGRAFSAGADVKEWAEGEPTSIDGEVSDDWVTTAHRVISRIYRLPKPVIAAVNGVAVGAGLDLALTADFRVAADTARFGSVYVKIGIPPDAGASFLLPRLVGMPKAKELIYTGRIIDAAEAHALGMVTELAPAAELMDAAKRWAGDLAAGPTVALGLAKENIHEHWTATIESALKSEERAGRLATMTEDHAEGLKAVNEKRAPNFVGH